MNKTVAEMKTAITRIRAVTIHSYPYRFRILALALLEPIKSFPMLLTPMITQMVIDRAYPARNFLLLGVLFGAMMGIGLITNVVAAVSGYLETYLTNLLEYRLGLRVCDAILHMPPSYREEHAPGMFLERANSDVACITQCVIHLAPQITAIIVTFVAAVVLMMRISVGISLIILVAVPLNYWTTVRMMQRAVTLNAEARAVMEKITTFTSETIEGATLTQVFCWTRARRRKYGRLLRKQLATKFAMWHTRAFWSQLSSLVRATWGIVLLGGGWYLVFIGQLQLGEAVALGMYAAILWQPFVQLEMLYQSLLSDSVSAQRVLELLEERQPSIRSRAHAVCTTPPRRFELRRLSFGYRKEHRCLRDISLKLSAGQTVAVVGPSGAGKSTLLRILCGLDDRYTGSFLVDGRDFRDIRRDTYFRHTALVPQTNFFFGESIRENLLSDRKASEEHLQKYAEMLGLAQVISSTAEGFDTTLGCQGIRFSTGQYQKLAVLRALLKPASILLLDEITSSMDIESERQLLQGISVLRSPDCLALLVTHHILITAEPWIDQIIVLADGWVQETGSYAELWARHGLYYRWLSHARRQQGNSANSRGGPAKTWSWTGVQQEKSA